MNRGLAFSALLHASLFVLVIAAPSSRGPRWTAPDAIAVELVASQPSRPAAQTAPPPVEAPVVEPVQEPPKEVVQPKPKVAKSATPPAPREIRKNAPRRRDETTLEERIRRRLSEQETDALEAAAPVPNPAAPAASSGASSTEVHATDFPYAWYLNTLRTRITDSWDPPGESLLAGRGNKVLVVLRVHRDGSVSDIRVEGASGTPGLDASARRAVERAQPFPPLPDGYDSESLEVAVRFTAGGSS